MKSARAKVKTLDELLALRSQLREAGKRVVFTNGCFDILHVGHLRYLEKARSLGDCLVVAVNSDESVRSLKGPGRPVTSESDRAELIAGLSCVDYVTLFSAPTPQEIINQIRPDVLVKGGDWAINEIVGREVVEAGGGTVLSIPLEAGKSTSAIISRIRENC